MSDADWSTNSTEATTIRLWQSGHEEAQAIATFPPAFTYPIFGEEESIFGYQDLRIAIDFAAHDLRSAVSWKHGAKFKSVGETEAMDLRAALADFVPTEALGKTTAEFTQELQAAEDSAAFVPPGERVREWTHGGRQYEIWAGQLTDPAVRALVGRAQTLVPLFIEGGTELQLDDHPWTMARWRVFFVYEHLASSPAPRVSVYSFVGYCTTYRFATLEPEWWRAGKEAGAQSMEGGKGDGKRDGKGSGTEVLFPPDGQTNNGGKDDDFDVLSLPYRGRISQFLILPEHAHRGHGSMLYATVFRHFHADPRCVEITVEDPNEAFDDLRDYCDFTRLLQAGALERVRLDKDVDPKLMQHSVVVAGKDGDVQRRRRLPTDAIIVGGRARLAAIRRDSKIAPRQFKRLLELWLLSRIPAASRQPGTARLTRRARTTDEGDRAYYYWRLLVKQRLWSQNRDALRELEQGEAVKHLEDTVDNLVLDYERLLAKLAERAMRVDTDGEGEAGGMDAGGAAAPSRRHKKRNLVVDDDDDDDDDEAGSDGARSKRQKSVVDA